MLHLLRPIMTSFKSYARLLAILSTSDVNIIHLTVRSVQALSGCAIVNPRVGAPTRNLRLEMSALVLLSRK